MNGNIVPLILDISVLVILVLFIILGRAKGFLSALIELVGQIIAVIAGGYLSSAAAGFIYTKFLQEKITTTITQSVANSTEIKSVVEGIESAIKNLPWLVSGTLQNNIGSLFEGFSQDLAETSSNLVGNILDSSIKPIIVGLLTMLIFTLIFSVISFLVKIASDTANLVSNVPIIGSANKTLGALLGGVKGVIIILVASAFLAVVINLTAGSLFVNDDSVNSSYIFKYIYNINPFNLIKTPQ